MRKSYTESDKERGIHLWATKGVSAAAREIGCTPNTIYAWVDERGLRGTQDRESIYQHKREQLKFKLMERVYFLLELMKQPVEGTYHFQGNVTHYHVDIPSASDMASIARAVQTFMDVIHLEEGEPTSRVESFDANILDKKLLDLANELSDKAKGLEVQEQPTESDFVQKLRDMEESAPIELPGNTPPDNSN